MSGTSVKLISALDSAVAVSSTDLVPITQGSMGAGTGITRKATMAQIAGSAGISNVKLAGVKGDGVTDDTAAITAAIAAGYIYFPAGTYLMKSPAIIPSTGATIIGVPGQTVFKPSATFNTSGTNGTVACFVTAGFTTTPPATPGTLGANIYVEGCTFDLTNWNQTLRATDGLYLIGFSKISIRNCVALGGMSLAQMVNCADVLVQGNRCYNSYGNACLDMWAGGKDVRVIGNYLHTVASTPAINWNASDGTGTIARTSYNLVVEGNTLYGSINLDTLGTNQYIDGVIIQGNKITCEYCIYGRGQAININISGNILDVTPVSGNSPIHGIWIDQAVAGGNGYTGNPNYITLTGNTIYGMVGYTMDGMHIYGNATVTGNTTYGAYQQALNLVTGGIISGNNFGNGQYGAEVIVNGSFGGLVNSANALSGNISQQAAIDALTATGTNLATAYVLTKPYSSFNTVAASTGAALPANAAAVGQMWVVWNNGANALTVYAQTGDTINYSASLSVAASAVARLVSFGDGLWRTA